MFTFPVTNMLAVPVMLGGVKIDLPFVGVVFGWMLIAALVGSALGILREYTSPRRSPGARGTADEAQVAVDHPHREAA
jgi:hypothetical protein